MRPTRIKFAYWWIKDNLWGISFLSILGMISVVVIARYVSFDIWCSPRLAAIRAEIAASHQDITNVEDAMPKKKLYCLETLC